VEESLVGHKVVGASAMVRSLCELEWGKAERRDGVRLARRRASDVPTRKEKRRGSGTRQSRFCERGYNKAKCWDRLAYSTSVTSPRH
jgi:hypothetical protein